MPARKQVTREMIMAAALDTLREGGIRAVNVTDLSKKLDCSTQPIYLSFSGMDALRAALAETAMAYFFHWMGFDTEGGQADLYGLPYIRFATEEKELFKYLFMRKDAFQELKPSLSPVMERSIARLMGRYHIGREEAHHFHDQLWMHTHGIAAMAAAEYCDWDMGKVERMLGECEAYLSKKYEA